MSQHRTTSTIGGAGALLHGYNKYTLTIVAVSDGCQCGAAQRLQRYVYNATCLSTTTATSTPPVDWRQGVLLHLQRYVYDRYTLMGTSTATSTTYLWTTGGDYVCHARALFPRGRHAMGRRRP